MEDSFGLPGDRNCVNEAGCNEEDNQDYEAADTTAE
jgi:hypothetical protein